MFLKYWKQFVLLINIMLLLLIITNVFGDNLDRTYRSQTQFGLVSHELHVSVPSSLYDYYQGKNPVLADDEEYSMLVTPDAVKPIAENIRNLTLDEPRSDEDFANAVLMLVHQIPYNNNDLKYPVETLVENSGKCDTLSLLAASIMKAGGLDVVLFYFKDVHHINVGVYLPYEPHTNWWWLPPTSYEFNGKKYWIAECTPAMEWKVGEMPPLLEGEQPCIITLEKSEKSSPARVSSKLGIPLNSSSISINLSAVPSDIINQERMLIISGSLSPACPNETVVLYFSQDGLTYSACNIETDSLGNYIFFWNVTSTGTYNIRTSWSGNANCTGADSEILTVFLGFPQSLIQFEGPTFYYTYGRAHIARYELSVRQGVEDFLDIQMSGNGLLLTGDFIIVRSGRIITIPLKGEIEENLGNIVIPRGSQPLRLPDDIEETTNNQFGFVLRNSGKNNYTLNVKGLDAYEMEKINAPGENATAFMNTSDCIKENTWYKVAAKISEDEVTAELQDANGAVIESISSKGKVTNVDELVILLANNTDRAVAFKNLKVETLYHQTQPEEYRTAVNVADSLPAYSIFIILVVTVLAVMVKAKKRKLNGARSP